MKTTSIFYFLLLFIFSNLALAQTKTPLLILSELNGKLLVDGEEVMSISKGEPAKISLDEGEHILQLKSDSETFTQTITCEGTKQKIIKFGLAKSSEPVPAASEIIVSNANITLPGALSNQSSHVEKYYAFDSEDEVKFSFGLLNKKGTLNFYLYSYPDNQIIFSRESIQDLGEQAVKINKKGVYRFVFTTNHVFARDCQFVIKRIPRSGGNQSFKTNVVVKWDTTYQEVLDTKVRVYSTTNLDHSNKTVVNINLPPKTTYWVYWIGVGQESMEQMTKFANALSKVSTLMVNPIQAFGVGLIKELPMFHSTATINYVFADNANTQLFVRNAQMQSYTFKSGSNVTTDYSKVEAIPREVSLCMWNNNMMVGHDVQVKVGAFIVRGKYIIQE
jgi:hypothetical protein